MNLSVFIENSLCYKCLSISRLCLWGTTQRVGNFHATHAMVVILVYLANFFFPDVMGTDFDLSVQDVVVESCCICAQSSSDAFFSFGCPALSELP